MVGRLLHRGRALYDRDGPRGGTALRARFDYRLFASDLSSQVLERARAAVYEESRAGIVPLSFKKRYMLKSTEREKGLVRMKPEILAKVSFERINFMDESYPVPNAVDVVFCRNVIIYLERRIQESILRKLSRHIAPEAG